MAHARTTLALTAWLLLLCSACEQQPPARPRASVVLISIDTLRADHLGSYGYHRPTSPHIDALAARGIQFDQAFSHSSRTAPAHMTMLTGLLPEAHGVVNYDLTGNTRLPDDIQTLASALAGAGYRTAAVTAGGNVSAAMGFDRGFERFTEVPFGPGSVQAVFDQGIERIQAWRGEPVFLFLHTYAVHDPYVPPEEFSAPFLDPDYAGAMLDSADELTAAGPEWIDQHRLYWSRVDPASPADVARLQDLYDGAIAQVDAQIGRLLQALERAGFRKRTLVIVTSDHGEEFGEHGGFQHGTLYEECLHVPLILAPPPAAHRQDIDIPARIAEPVGLVDLTPTVLSLLNVPVPDDLQGHSLERLLRGAQGGAPKLMARYPRRGLTSLRVGDLKLIVDETRADSELYDLVLDPAEQDDRAWHEFELHQELMQQLRLLRAESQQRLAEHGATPAAELDEQTLRHLQALGYLGEDGPR